jgi:hypothetical protein
MRSEIINGKVIVINETRDEAIATLNEIIALKTFKTPPPKK